MKKIFSLLLVIFALFSFASGQTTEEQTIMKMERDILVAWEKGDVKTLETLLADDYTETSEVGDLLRKDILKHIKPLNTISYNIAEMKVRIYGNAAIVNDLMEVRTKTQDKNTKLNYFRYTDTYIKGKNGWQQAATQYARTPVWTARNLSDSELKPLTAMSCDHESGIKSLNDDVMAYHRVVNSTEKPIKVIWITHEGKREDKPSVVEAGKTGTFHTFLTHPFVITDDRGKCLGVYQPIREPGITIIK